MSHDNNGVEAGGLAGLTRRFLGAWGSMSLLSSSINMSRHDPITLRPIREDDLDAVLRVQAACYPPVMQEAADVVRARIRAYVFAYRSGKGAVTPLDAPFEVQEAGDTLYIHDLSVAPDAAGQGLARQLVERLLALAGAQGLGHCALVSVQDSQRFWERLGFREAACGDAAARQALASYPPVALYMCRGVGRGTPHPGSSSLL